MVVVSYSGKEINGKLVYYGPGLSGKTTNLEYIYQSVPSSNRGKMVSMKTRTERTLFFDFLPVDLGEMGGFKTRFLLYTVPGQVYYNATRKLVLRGVDAVIFVADSERGKMDENIESLQNLRDNLSEYGLELDKIPWVIQYNKRDLEDVYSIEELEQALNPTGVPYFEAVATTGPGVFETFRGIAKLLLQKLSKEIKLGESKASESRTAPAAAPAPAVTQAPPIAERPPSREMPYRPRRGDMPEPVAPRAEQTPPLAPEPVPAPREDEPVAAEPPASMPVSEPPQDNPVPMAAVQDDEPRSERGWGGPERSTPDVPQFDEPEPVAEEGPAEPVEATADPEPEPEREFEPVEATADEDGEPEREFEPVEAMAEEDGEPERPEAEIPEPAAAEMPEEPPVRKLEPVLPEARDHYAAGDEDKPGFWGRLFTRNRKDHRSTYRSPGRMQPAEAEHKTAAPRQARVAEVKIPAVAGSGETSPVFIEKRIQVPITLGPEELVRGATLRLVLEIQVEASADKDETEEHRAA